MRYLLAVLVYLVSLAVVAALALLIAIVLAGPHAGLLPEWAEILVLAMGWTTVIALPVWTAHRFYRWLLRGK